MALPNTTAPVNHHKLALTPIATTKNLPIKPSVIGIPASDNIITVITADRIGLCQNKPR
ncbi:hypothetical protein YPPY16_2965 [Yersinia pestis PY-16]|nr:hypothetical protein YPPY16_2965 [Yersinia pestis PY-16]